MVNDYFGGFYVNSSDCASHADEPENESCPCSPCALPVMAYIPDQSFGSLYEPCEGLFYGTLFRQLNKPFEGKGCKRCGC